MRLEKGSKEQSDREMTADLHDESRSVGPQPSQPEDGKSAGSSAEIHGPPMSHSDDSAKEALPDENWIQKMKSLLSDQVSRVNKELWLILSLLVIAALMNYLSPCCRIAVR